MLLFNLLEEIMVRNTRPFIRPAYPNATINGKPVRFPDRALRTIEYDLGAAYGGLYQEIVVAIERLSLAPYQLESYRKPSAVRDEQEHQWDKGREVALVGIFKTRFLKRLESSVFAFRESLRRALVFEETYLDYLLDGTVVSSRDFQKLMRFLARDEEDEPAAGSVAEDLDAVAEARAYLEGLPTVDLNQYDLRKLRRQVEQDIELLRGLYERTAAIAAADGKLERLKHLLATGLKDKKVLIFSSFKDTSRDLHRQLTAVESADWRRQAGNPHIRRIDSGNHPEERGAILAQFAPAGQRKRGNRRAADRHSHQHRRALRRSESPGLRHVDQLRPDLESGPPRATQRPHRPNRQSPCPDRHQHLQLFSGSGVGRIAPPRRAVAVADLGHR